MFERTGYETMSEANSGTSRLTGNDSYRVAIECSPDDPFDPSIHHSQSTIVRGANIGFSADDCHLDDDWRIDSLGDMVKEHTSLYARHRAGICPVEYNTTNNQAKRTKPCRLPFTHICTPTANHRTTMPSLRKVCNGSRAAFQQA
ncbi:MULTISPECIES: hypothetical protein [unclassified Bradyrhizobium]|uniref:hypothetical protein n=1 Tax=unclassified Bradyrhizobium TaxID=2631580 RepID=UPI002916189D|nr:MULTISPECIES: hypothetical protein [unclassified Bradyrhizobium]